MSAAARARPDREALLVLLAAVCLALITILSVWRLKRCKYKLMYETGGAMFYGVLLGSAVKYLSLNQAEPSRAAVCSCVGLNSTPHVLTLNATPHLHCYRHVGRTNQGCPTVSAPRMETFDPEVIFNLFLSPIIFHGAYTLNQRRFFENLGSVLTFAFLGTIISCVTIGACVYGFLRLMVLLGHAADGDSLLTDCLLFGAIMSPTDPASVLGLLSELRVDPDLHVLLFGESVLNDAVALALTHAITSYIQTGAGRAFDPAASLHALAYFLGVLAGSLLLGFMFAAMTALLTKFTQLRHTPLLEACVLFLLSWTSFLSAEAAGLSGIVAVLFCGMSQARYTRHNLSPEGRTRAEQLFEVFNFLGEIFIFGYMGYVLLTFPHHVFKALFISGAFLSLFISRAFNVYPLSFLLNLGRTNKIPRSFQHFMTFAGLRGAVAFSLVMHIDRSTEVRRAILTTALLLIGFTVWVLGAAADPVLRRLDIRAGEHDDERPDEAAAGRPDTTPGLWHRLDYKYVTPALTRRGPPLADSLPRCCGALARLLGAAPAQEDEEQLCDAEPEESTFGPEETGGELLSVSGDDGSERQEDLVEGDLGLGSAPALAREA
ncbi:sodium/hydrogen exchanger 9-like isoform X2 [Betta splendens]|uniref:Sodium/hydrogen exchanger n=1 Tax=Betta splendens TaxID=158456 RepID=A0A6P7MC45_BETSP|nr:sodium/hydrogen exchanger 9-like isoform X2 [Betta splendens]